MNKKSVKQLDDAITTALGGPGGDPDRCNLEPAAAIVAVLIREGHGEAVDNETLLSLHRDNIYDSCFLKEFMSEQSIKTIFNERELKL